MGQIISLHQPGAMDEAWDAFAGHAARLMRDPALIADRSYMERHAILHERWKRLFLADAGR